MDEGSQTGEKMKVIIDMKPNKYRSVSECRTVIDNVLQFHTSDRYLRIKRINSLNQVVYKFINHDEISEFSTEGGDPVIV